MPATPHAVYNPGPVSRWLAAARQSRAAFAGMWDSNGQWPDQQSGTSNHGRRYGHLVGQFAIGLQWKGFAPLAASRSATNGRYASGFTNAVVPYDITANSTYGRDAYDDTASGTVPANLVKFMNHEANGAASTFHDRLHPLDFRFFDNGDAIESTLGRVAGPTFTLKAGSAISSDNLRARLYYADGTDDSADGSNRGQFRLAWRDGTTELTAATTNANTGAIATAYADLAITSAQLNRAANLTFVPGTSSTGSIKGPLMILGAGVWSEDRGHVMHSVLHSVAGATTANGKAAVTNASDEMLAWWMQEITRPMGGAAAVLLIDVCYGVNDEAASYASIKTDTTAIVNRLRGVWTSTLGRDAANLPILLSVPQPVTIAGNTTEADFIAGLGAQYREIAAGLDATVYDATQTATALEYVANGWNHTGDTLNHHLSTTGYGAGYHTLQWRSLGLASTAIARRGAAHTAQRTQMNRRRRRTA